MPISLGVNQLKHPIWVLLKGKVRVKMMLTVLLENVLVFKLPLQKNSNPAAPSVSSLATCSFSISPIDETPGASRSSCMPVRREDHLGGSVHRHGGDADTQTLSDPSESVAVAYDLESHGGSDIGFIQEDPFEHGFGID